MKKYVVKVYDTVAEYTLEAKSQKQAEEKAKKMYQEKMNSWLVPHSVEVVDEYEEEAK